MIEAARKLRRRMRRAWAVARRGIGAPERLVVVDAGTWALTAIEVERGAGRTAIAAVLRRERRGDEPWTDDAIASSLRNWMAEARVRARRAIFVAAPRRSFASRLELPPIPPRERPAALRWEMARHAAGEGEALLADAIRDDPHAPRPSRLGVAVEAAHAEGLARIAAEAGLRLAGIAVTADVLRALRARLALDASGGAPGPTAVGERSERALALVEIGASRTQVACFRGTRLEFAREVALGGQAITDALTGAVASGGGRSRLSLAEAESAKRRVRLEAADAAAAEGTTFPLIRPVLERLAGEIAMSVHSYREQLGGPPLGEVWLLGGGASLDGLDRWLAAQLGVPVRRLDPLAVVEARAAARAVLASHPASAFGVVIGAALAEPPGPQLLHPAVRREASLRRGIAAAWAGLLLAGAAAAGVAIWHRAETGRAAGLLRSLRPSAVAAQHRLRAAAEARQRLEALRPAAELARGPLEAEPYWDGLLKDLAQAVPREVTLREFAVGTDRTAKLLGSARDSSRPAAEAVVGFLERLRSSPFFAGVRLGAGYEADGSARLEFEILGRVE